MTEMALTKKARIKRNQGGGTGPLPLKRKYERERIEVKSKHKEVVMKPNDPRVIRLAKLREQAEKEQEVEKERGIQGAIRELQQQRKEQRKAEARRDAAAEADEIAHERHKLEERMEAEADALNRSIGDLESLDRRHRDALRRAGQDVGHAHSLRTLLPQWFAHRFGGFRSPTGITGSHPSGKERRLSTRDPLASPHGNDAAS